MDTVGGAGGTEQHEEYSLGTIDITDGTFNIYVQDADMLGTGYNFFGWAWIRLVPVDESAHQLLGRRQPESGAGNDRRSWPIWWPQTGSGPSSFIRLFATIPSILADADEEDYGLPVMQFFRRRHSNGKYEVIANLYTSGAGRDMRYFYGFTPE